MSVEVFVTAFIAIFVFVAGQALLRFVVEPIQEQRRLIGEVASALFIYANVIRFEEGVEQGKIEIRGASEEEFIETNKALRELAGRLRASLWSVPFYDTLAFMGRRPKKYEVLEVSNELFRWSNILYDTLKHRQDEQRLKCQQIIADRLGITKKISEVG